MRDALLSILLVIAILGLSALLTHWLAKAMYVACKGCGTLNARRRVECRECGARLRDRSPPTHQP